MSHFMSRERMARWQASINDPKKALRVKKIMKNAKDPEMSARVAIHIDNERQEKRKKK